MSSLRDELKKNWKTLLQETTNTEDASYAKIRLQTPLKCDFFAAMDFPYNRLMLIIKIPSENILPGYKYPDISGLEIKPKYEKGRTKIFLKVIDEKYNELFESLCLDLIGEALNASGSKKCIERFFYKLHIWQDFFNHLDKRKLDTKSVQGLFGELFYLYQISTDFMPLSEAVSCWAGPSGSEYDFRYPNGSLEVKTVKTTSDTITVSNLYQLDDEKCGNLFLAHLSVEVFPENSPRGMSLPHIVTLIRNELNSHPSVLEFDRKLVAAGYIENDFNDMCFDVVNYFFYTVADDFPRLIFSNVPEGIKSAKYAIDLGLCKKYVTESQTVFNTLMEKQDA